MMDTLNEEQFKRSVENLRIDCQPPAGHREELKRRMLASFAGHVDESRTIGRPRLKGVFNMRNWKSQLAAAGLILAVGAGLYLLLGSHETAQAYSIGDVAKMIRGAKTLHVKGYNWLYDEKQSDFATARMVPLEWWADVPNQRKRDISFAGYTDAKGPHLEKMEILQSDQTQLWVNHTLKTSHRSRISSLRAELNIRQFIDEYAAMVQPGYLEGYRQVGTETIEAVEYAIWENATLVGPNGEEIMMRCWVAPKTGQVGRIQRWHRPTGGDWRPSSVIEVVEINRPIAAEVFTLEVPKSYRQPDTLPASLPSEKAYIPPKGLSLDQHYCFTLDDGSVLVAWSVRSKTFGDRYRALTRLNAGDPFGDLPVVLDQLQTTPDAFHPRGKQPLINYAGRHLACIEKDGELLEWGLYLPQEKPAWLPRRIYRAFCRVSNAGKESLVYYNPIHGPTLDRGEFDHFVGQATREALGEVKLPPALTYENVTRLAAQLRPSLAKTTGKLVPPATPATSPAGGHFEIQDGKASSSSRPGR